MSWYGADSLSLTSHVSPAADSASKMLRRHTVHDRRTAQSAEDAVTLACPVQPASVREYVFYVFSDFKKT